MTHCHPVRIWTTLHDYFFYLNTVFTLVLICGIAKESHRSILYLVYGEGFVHSSLLSNLIVS